MLKRSNHAQQNHSKNNGFEKKQKTFIHTASVFPAFFVSSFPSCPLSPPHDVTGDSREAPKVIHPLAITNTCFDRLAVQAHADPCMLARTWADIDRGASACSNNTHTHTRMFAQKQDSATFMKLSVRKQLVNAW